MSQLVDSLEAELAISSDPIRRAELQARIAVYRARVGDFDVSRAHIANLRSAFGHGQDGRATIWIMLAESVLQYFSELSPVALDRIARAELLAIAGRYQPAISILAAWKAHIEFEIAQYPQMFRSLELGLINATDQDLDAQTRLAMVISNLSMVCGDDVCAQTWFLRGRDFAVRNGDQASIEALLFNRVGFRFTELRAQYCRNNADLLAVQAIRREIDSAANLQMLIRTSALTNHIHLVSARAALLAGDFEAAINGLQSVRHEEPFATHNFSQHFIDLELSYCLASRGELDASLQLFNSIDLKAFQNLDLDERLVAAWISLKLCCLDVRFGSLSEATGRWQLLSDEYAEFQFAMREKLAALLGATAS